jgi:peptidoglycan-associated lipoprotein
MAERKSIFTNKDAAMTTPVSDFSFQGPSGLGSILLSSLLVLGLTACGSSVKLNDKAPPVEVRAGQSIDPSSSSGAAGASNVEPVDLSASGADAGKAARVIYFDFDSFVIKEEFKPAVDAHAKRLVADRKKQLVVEGHTDERGGSEYNLALGQKRAEAVARSLSLLGVKAEQVESVSFGKERPAASGSDEGAWAQNRRAEIKAK